MHSSAVCPNAPTFTTSKKSLGLTLKVMTDRTCQVNTNNLEAGHRQAGRLYAKMYITPAVNGNTPSNTREPRPSFLYYVFLHF